MTSRPSSLPSLKYDKQLYGAAQGLRYLHGANLIHGDLKGVSVYSSRDRFLFVMFVQQANILMSNGRSPRACLADFGFMTMVLDPSQPMSCGTQLEGGTMMFVSPELLVPKRFGFTGSVPTPEADIYTFELVVYQVCEHGRGYLPFTYIVQVLTGDIPFPNLRVTELTLNVVQGVHPPKPENASAIGLSDILWRFIQRCWDGDIESRPKVSRVASHLEKAAAEWVGVMPPCAQIESTTSASPEPVSDSMVHCKFYVLVFP